MSNYQILNYRDQTEDQTEFDIVPNRLNTFRDVKYFLGGLKRAVLRPTFLQPSSNLRGFNQNYVLPHL